MKWVEGSVRFLRFCRVACREVLYGTSSMAKKTLGRAHVANLWPLNTACFTPSLCCVFFIGHQLLEDTLSDRRRKVQHVHTTSKFVARPFFCMSDWHVSTNNKTDHFLWMPLQRNHGSFVYNYSAISSPFVCFPLHCMQIIDEGKLKGKEERKYAEQKQERKGVAHYYYSTTSWLLR